MGGSRAGDEEAFLAGLAEILELAPTEVAPELVLHDGNWDSLAIISCIGLIDECFGVTVAGSQLRTCSSVAELIGLARAAAP